MHTASGINTAASSVVTSLNTQFHIVIVWCGYQIITLPLDCCWQYRFRYHFRRRNWTSCGYSCFNQELLAAVRLIVRHFSSFIAAFDGPRYSKYQSVQINNLWLMASHVLGYCREHPLPGIPASFIISSSPRIAYLRIAIVSNSEAFMNDAPINTTHGFWSQPSNALARCNRVRRQRCRRSRLHSCRHQTSESEFAVMLFFRSAEVLMCRAVNAPISCAMHNIQYS